MTNTKTLLDFVPLTVADREEYASRIALDLERGCEFTFANLYLWGDQRICRLGEDFLFLSRFGERYVYPFPLLSGDVRSAIDAILSDAEARGIVARITGLGQTARTRLEAAYPDRFRFFQNDGSFDYVYAIDDLAELAGKRYDAKRNHIRRFVSEHPGYTVEPIGKDNLDAVRSMAEAWYRARLAKDPEADMHGERRALFRALDEWDALGLEGLLLRDGTKVLAITAASFLREDTLDVHFEKADAGVTGAYAVINFEFARRMREKHPALRFLDREEDMGIPGLRRAKESYHPHHRVEKWWATPKEACDEA